jgi:hypothetical protein
MTDKAKLKKAIDIMARMFESYPYDVDECAKMRGKPCHKCKPFIDARKFIEGIVNEKH